MKMLAVAAVAASALVALASPASATDFSFTGLFTADNNVQFFNFSVTGESVVTLRTYSYAGGTNAAGDVIARGGFDPILSLYDASTGDRVAQNDDGGCGLVAEDAVSGQCWDTSLSTDLLAGNYTVAVSQYDNFGPGNLADAFPHDGDSNFRNGFTDVSNAPNNPRDGHWAFDVLNADTATQGPTDGGVPEPATWGLMLSGFGLAGAALRRRRAALAA
jgi:WD40 repeat protein